MMRDTKLIPLTDAEIDALLSLTRGPWKPAPVEPLSREHIALLSAELKLMEAVS
jgi:hypothetical protein